MAQRSAGQLAPKAVHYARIGRALAVASAAMTAWLVIGTVFYRGIEDFAWIDAFHQSAMLAAGMGPVKEINTVTGKLFDSFYALVSGFVMLGAAGYLFAPFAHRMLRRYHIEDADAK
jgi:hypothetical protein